MTIEILNIIGAINFDRYSKKLSTLLYQNFRPRNIYLLYLLYSMVQPTIFPFEHTLQVCCTRMYGEY